MATHVHKYTRAVTPDALRATTDPAAAATLVVALAVRHVLDAADPPADPVEVLRSLTVHVVVEPFGLAVIAKVES